MGKREIEERELNDQRMVFAEMWEGKGSAGWRSISYDIIPYG